MFKEIGTLSTQAMCTSFIVIMQVDLHAAIAVCYPIIHNHA